MKKLFISIFCLFMIGNVFSQKISGGLFFAPRVSWLTSESKTSKNDGARISYSFGAMLDFNFIDNFAFSTGVSYSNFRGKLNFPYGIPEFKADETANVAISPGSTITYNLDYISIPIGLKGKTNEIGYMTYFLKMGLDPMVNVKAKAKFYDYEDFIRDEIRLFNLGWHIGGGFEWSLHANTRLLVELTYTGGISDFDKTEIYKVDSNTETDNTKSRIHDISLKVGILF